MRRLSLAAAALLIAVPGFACAQNNTPSSGGGTGKPVWSGHTAPEAPTRPGTVASTADRTDTPEERREANRLYAEQYARDQAERDRVATTNAERERIVREENERKRRAYEAEVARVRAENERRQREWREAVRRCEAGDVTACRQP